MKKQNTLRIVINTDLKDSLKKLELLQSKLDKIEKSLDRINKQFKLSSGRKPLGG